MKILVNVLFVLVLHVCCKETIARASQKFFLDAIDAQCCINSDENVSVYDVSGYLIENNDKVNELVRCNWEKLGVLYENRIDYYKLQRMLENHLVGHYDTYVSTYLASKTLRDCDGVKGNSSGDACVKLHNCIHRQLDANVHLLNEERN